MKITINFLDFWSFENFHPNTFRFLRVVVSLNWFCEVKNSSIFKLLFWLFDQIVSISHERHFCSWIHNCWKSIWISFYHNEFFYRFFLSFSHILFNIANKRVPCFQGNFFEHTLCSCRLKYWSFDFFLIDFSLKSFFININDFSPSRFFIAYIFID